MNVGVVRRASVAGGWWIVRSLLHILLWLRVGRSIRIRLSVSGLTIRLGRVSSTRLCLVRDVSLNNDELLPACTCEAAPYKRTKEESNNNIANRRNAPVSAIFDNSNHVDYPDDRADDIASDATSATVNTSVNVVGIIIRAG